MEQPTSLVPTRRALHGVAELVLAGPQHAVADTVRLRVVEGGFATSAGDDVRLVGTAVRRGERAAPVDGTTPRALALALGLEATPPVDAYPGGSGVGLDETLHVDPSAAAVLGRAWSVGDAALRRLDPDQEPVLWPEHFDVGISADRVNYGVSPGDTAVAAPYAYVGPWTVPPSDAFWTEPFGAVHLLDPDTGVDEVLAFFVEGRRRAP